MRSTPTRGDLPLVELQMFLWQAAWSVSYHLQTGYSFVQSTESILQRKTTRTSSWESRRTRHAPHRMGVRLNREDLTARQFLYSDIPKHYVFIDRRSGQSEEEVVTESSAGCSQSAPEIPRSFTCVSSFYVLCQEPQALMTWRQLTVPFQAVSEKRAFKGVSSQMIQRTITRWQ